MSPRALLAVALIAVPLATVVAFDNGFLTVPSEPELSDSTDSAMPFEVGGSFALIDHTGAQRRHSDFRGQAQIVYFGYTACPQTCSTALVNIAATLDHLAAAGDDVGAIFITIDPTHDTPERLAGYLPRIHPRLVGLTGDADEIKRVQWEWRIGARRVTDSGIKRLFDHSPIAYLMGPEGDVLTLFPPILPPERIAAIIRGYL